jgi:hypothetical protein
MVVWWRWETRKHKWVRWAQDGRSLLGRPTVGDWVSLHWDWACEILVDPTQLEHLQRRTENQLATTNRAIAPQSPPH